MKRYIVMMLFSSFIGIMSSPEILSASNSVAVTGLNESGIVETVIPKPVVDNTDQAGTDYTPFYYPEYNDNSSSTNDEASVEVYSNEGYGAAIEPEYLSFWVTQQASSIVVSPSYSDIYQTGKLIYGHNTSNLLYDLNYLYVGDVFMLNGNLYRVADRIKYEKVDDYTLKNPNTGESSRSVMKKLKNNAYGHTVALMTCTGTYYGNGDASHRLVIFADAI